jgi:hypothetical protein
MNVCKFLECFLGLWAKGSNCGFSMTDNEFWGVSVHRNSANYHVARCDILQFVTCTSPAVLYYAVCHRGDEVSHITLARY